MGCIKNESLKLKYASIDGMRVANDEELGQLKEQAKLSYDKQKTGFSEFNVEYYAALLESDSPTFIEIVSYKLIDKSLSESDLVKMETDQYKTDQTTIQSHKIGDTEFSKASNVKISDTAYTLFFKKVDDHLIMILLSAAEEEKVNKLLSGFSKL